MTLKENIIKLQTYKMFEGEETLYVERDDVLKLLEQETNIKSLGDELRIFRNSITDDKVLIGFNMAVAICNKYFAESEVVNGEL